MPGLLMLRLVFFWMSCIIWVAVLTNQLAMTADSHKSNTEDETSKTVTYLSQKKSVVLENWPIESCLINENQK
jgi:hypothetical protein